MTGLSGNSFGCGPDAGEMLHQQLRDGRDTCQNAALEIPAAKLRFHSSADRFPLGLLNLLINAAIGNNLDVAISEQEIDQNAAVFSVSQTRSCENTSMARARAG